MSVLVTCKFDKDQLKSEGDCIEMVFPIISQWELSVLMESAPKPNSSLSPIPLMLHIKDWPTDLGNSIISLLKI